MSISSQIERLTNSRDAIKNAIAQKGVSVPSSAKISEMAEYIASIQQGGGVNIEEVEELPVPTTSDIGRYVKFNGDVYECKFSGAYFEKVVNNPVIYFKTDSNPMDYLDFPDGATEIPLMGWLKTPSTDFSEGIMVAGMSTYDEGSDSTIYAIVAVSLDSTEGYLIWIHSEDLTIAELNEFWADYDIQITNVGWQMESLSLTGDYVPMPKILIGEDAIDYEISDQMISGVPLWTNRAMSFLSGVIDGSLSEIEIPYGVKKIKFYVFVYTNLTKVKIPNTVEEIGAYAFSLCQFLNTIDLPDSINTIGEYAFSDSGLRNIVIPKNVTAISTSTFSNCSSLESVTLPQNLNSIGSNAFSSCNSLKYISLPDGLTTIESYAFYWCSNLKKIIIPVGVTTINASTFYRCDSLTSATILGKVTNIYNDAFNYCYKLTTVVLNRTDAVIPLNNRSAFSNTPSTLKIYVPDSLVNSYKSATNWSSYSSKIYPLSQLPAETEV